MIVIEEKRNVLKATVYGELVLADFRELERAVTSELRAAPTVKMLIDLRDMLGYTLDVAWEEVRFSRKHPHDFRRIAVITAQRFAPWLSWVTAAFTDAEVALFEDPAAAEVWLAKDTG